MMMASGTINLGYLFHNSFENLHFCLKRILLLLFDNMITT